MTDDRHPNGGLFIGILVTVMGVIFLLDQLDIVHARYVFQVFWPLILIGLGLSILYRTSDFRGTADGGHLYRARRSTGLFWGPVLIIIGGLSLLSNLTNVDLGRLWPLWLVAVGVWLLVNRSRYDEIRRARRWRHDGGRYGRYGGWGPTGPGSTPGFRSGPNPTSAGFAGPATEGGESPASQHGQGPVGPPPPPHAPGPAGPSSSDYGSAWHGSSDESVDDTFERSVIFMSFNRRILSRHFRFGKISAILGGFHIDFTGAEMEGNQAVVQIEAIFGGGEILVPPTWRVSVTAHEIAGAIVDETTSRPDSATPAKVLLIHGTTVFGGVVIKN